MQNYANDSLLLTSVNGIKPITFTLAFNLARQAIEFSTFEAPPISALKDMEKIN